MSLLLFCFQFTLDIHKNCLLRMCHSEERDSVYILIFHHHAVLNIPPTWHKCPGAGPTDFCFLGKAYCWPHHSKFHLNQCVSKYLEAMQYDSAIWFCKDKISQKKKLEHTFSLLFTLIGILKAPGESTVILKLQIHFRFSSSL